MTTEQELEALDRECEAYIDKRFLGLSASAKSSYLQKANYVELFWKFQFYKEKTQKFIEERNKNAN